MKCSQRDFSHLELWTIKGLFEDPELAKLKDTLDDKEFQLIYSSPKKVKDWGIISNYIWLEVFIGGAYLFLINFSKRFRGIVLRITP